MIYLKFEVAEYNQISTELDIVVYDFQTGSELEVFSRLLKLFSKCWIQDFMKPIPKFQLSISKTGESPPIPFVKKLY